MDLSSSNATPSSCVYCLLMNTSNCREGVTETENVQRDELVTKAVTTFCYQFNCEAVVKIFP